MVQPAQPCIPRPVRMHGMPAAAWKRTAAQAEEWHAAYHSSRAASSGIHGSRKVPALLPPAAASLTHRRRRLFSHLLSRLLLLPCPALQLKKTSKKGERIIKRKAEKKALKERKAAIAAAGGKKAYEAKLAAEAAANGVELPAPAPKKELGEEELQRRREKRQRKKERAQRRKIAAELKAAELKVLAKGGVCVLWRAGNGGSL